jgi:hypothetical protein
LQVVEYRNLSRNSDRTIIPHASDQCTLYLTDWTHNPLLYDFPASEMQPTGQRVIQISIFGNQNEPLLGMAPEKLKGRLVSLRNVRQKIGLSDYLEATMVEDFKYNDRRDVKLVNDPREISPDLLKAFKEFVLFFFSFASSPSPRFVDVSDPFFRRRLAYYNGGATTSSLAPVFNVGGSAKEEKKPVDPLCSSSFLFPVSVPPTDQSPPRAAEICDFTGLSSTPQDIASALLLNSPGTYHFRVRVADFQPSRVADWVQAFCPECDEMCAPPCFILPSFADCYSSPSLR